MLKYYVKNILFAIVFFFAGSITQAQSLIKLKIPASDFAPAEGKNKVKFEDNGDRRIFRGDAFATVVLTAKIKLPQPGAGENKLRGIVVHFSTSKDGPSMRTVALKQGNTAVFNLNTHVSGDFTVTEKVQPAEYANAWHWNDGISVYPYSVISITIMYPGGFDSQVDAGEFVLNNVEVLYPRTIQLGQSSTTVKPIQSMAQQATVAGAGTGATKSNSMQTANVAGDNTLVATTGIIYVISDNKDLKWYHHTGYANGSFSWAAQSGNKVGENWDFQQLFSGNNGIIYAINSSNELLWYNNTGFKDGSFKWAPQSGNKIGTGWDFKQVFYGGKGVIYAINADNELFWYRHNGYMNGTAEWAPGSGNEVGTGWDFKQIFSGGNGIIYAINENNDLLWYKHEGYKDGSFTWAAQSGSTVGTGWDFKQIFSGGNGVIYAINANNDLLWYKHEGYKDGSVTWAAQSGSKIGNGWDVENIFSF